MLLCNSRTPNRLLSLVLMVVPLVLQMIQQMELDHSLSNLPDISSAVSSAALIILILSNIVSVFMSMMVPKEKDSDGKTIQPKRNMAMDAARNFLGGVALVFEFLAAGLRDGSLSGEESTRAGIILGCLVALRLLDALTDFDDWFEVFSVQCIHEKPMNMMLRIVMVHLLIGASIGLDMVSLIRAEEKIEINGNSTAWKTRYINGDEHEGEDQSVRTLSIVTFTLLCVHLVLYPANALIKATCEKRCIDYSACKCICPNKYNAIENCPEENPLRRQQETMGNRKPSLVALSRLPIIRQLVATTILVGLSYVGGATYPHQETQFRVGALIAYAAYDVIGRNKL
tara:strand:+ start:182 stop:1207 length:1026 start_codon:yes stop_codon:yes gene_type:complete